MSDNQESLQPGEHAVSLSQVGREAGRVIREIGLQIREAILNAAKNPGVTPAKQKAAMDAYMNAFQEVRPGAAQSSEAQGAAQKHTDTARRDKTRHDEFVSTVLNGAGAVTGHPLIKGLAMADAMAKEAAMDGERNENFGKLVESMKDLGIKKIGNDPLEGAAEKVKGAIKTHMAIKKIRGHNNFHGDMIYAVTSGPDKNASLGKDGKLDVAGFLQDTANRVQAAKMGGESLSDKDPAWSPFKHPSERPQNVQAKLQAATGAILEKPPTRQQAAKLNKFGINELMQAKPGDTAQANVVAPEILKAALPASETLVPNHVLRRATNLTPEALQEAMLSGQIVSDDASAKSDQENTDDNTAKNSSSKKRRQNLAAMPIPGLIPNPFQPNN